LFFIDRDQQKSGFAERVAGDADVELSMEPMTATYSGTLLDENARPMSDRTLWMWVKSSDAKAVAAQQTDKTGRFRFTSLPCKVPLQLSIRDENDRPDYFLVDVDRMFNPGEVRENDQLKPRRIGSSPPSARSSVPLANSIENLCRNARVSGLRVLVALPGDDSQDAARAIDQMFDDGDQRTTAALSYLILRVQPAQLTSEAAILPKYSWPKPAPGEIVLVVLDGDQKSSSGDGGYRRACHRGDRRASYQGWRRHPLVRHHRTRWRRPDNQSRPAR
jgi:hypothetical protein